MQVNVPTTFGYGGYYDNIGEMSNKGIEASLNYNKQISQVAFNAGVNFAYNKNKVLSLGDLDDQKGCLLYTSGTNFSYCDVETCISPMDRVDYDYRTPGAGKFRTVF